VKTSKFSTTTTTKSKFTYSRDSKPGFLSTNRLIKSRTVRWMGNVARRGEKRNAY
jgi:hypothetical protein